MDRTAPEKGSMSQVSPFFENPEEITREEILDALISFYPKGPGPLGMKRIICGVLLNIAVLRGFEPITSEEIHKVYVEQNSDDL